MMANDSSDESSSSEISAEKTPKKLQNDSGFTTDKRKHQIKQKYREDNYNTFVVPEILCQCQQKCTDRVTPSLIQKIAMYFFGLSGNKDKQKSYLASLILGRENYVNVKTMKGKRIRKMSYRYFVPILTDDDLKEQSKESSEDDLSFRKIKNPSGKLKLNPLFTQKNWDHVEVCLKAFTNVHTISEKKVIVTRTVCELNQTLRCSKPFQKDNLHSHNMSQHESKVNNNISKYETVRNNANIPSSSNIGAETAAWLTKHSQNQNNNSFRVNPKTFLPEGLILPDSMICVPIFTDSEYAPTDPERDADIVDTFFYNQLWKPEYMPNCGSKSGNERM